MRGRLWLLAVTAMALVTAAFAAPPPLTTATLTLDAGTCSGTVIAPQVILSAGHCFSEEENELGYMVPPPDTMQVDWFKVKILAVVLDDADHAMVKVDFVFKEWAPLGKVPEPGTKVHYWGNPVGFSHAYREGYVTGYRHSQIMMDVNGFFGDSGSGIFDESGHVVGVMSFISVQPYGRFSFRQMGAFPLEFSPLQYSMMGVTAP